MRDFDPTAGEFAGHDAIQITSRHYDVGSILGGGASLLSGVMGADAAEDAARIQAGATDRANAITQKQFEQTRSDLTPYRNLGAGATNLLAQYLGLPGGGGAGGFGAEVESRDAIRARLLPQFQTQSTATAPGYHWENDVYVEDPGTSTLTTNDAALNAAIEAEFARQTAAQQQAGQAAQQNPNFGSLLKNFTGEDLASEPGYQFGLKEGMNAVNNRLASAGSYFSGAALKGATRFANDYASTKYGDAFNRDSANKTRTYNFLTGAVNTGQNAAAMTGQAGAAMAGQVGANTTAMGNAAGAARIAGGNAIAGGITGAVDAWQQNRLIDRITGGNVGFGSTAGRGYTVPTYANPEY